ncbi:MAG: sugar phosphate isomerase/epimerase family protein [Candidatus Methanomethylicia archaeon]
MFNIGVSSLCFISKDFEVFIDSLKFSNIRFWEIVDDGPHFLDLNKISLLLNAISSEDIIFSLHAPYTSVNISATNYKVRKFSMDVYIESVEHAHAIGCKYIVFHPGLLDSFSYLFNDLRDSVIESIYFLLSLGDKCASYGITPLLENLATERSTILSINSFKDFLSKSSKFMVALDISHAHVMGLFNGYLNNLHNRIAYLHISGNDDKADRHWPLNVGSQYWRGYLKEILNFGFNCPLIIENLSYFDALKSLDILKSFFKNEFSTEFFHISI